MLRKLCLTLGHGTASGDTANPGIRLSLADSVNGHVIVEEETYPSLPPEAPWTARAADWYSWSEKVIPFLLPTSIRRCLVELSGKGAIQLSVYDPDRLCSHVPWEGLCHHDFPHGLLSIGGIRWVRLGQRDAETAQTGEECTRCLVAWADPGSAAHPPLPTAKEEAERIASALRDHGMQVDLLPSATPAGLTRALKAARYGLFHFSGHADCLSTGGALILESGRTGDAEPLYADDLASCLRADLVFLAACKTGAAGGVAETLALAGVPAVVAFQNTTPDTSATQFCTALYSGLTRGANISEATHEARGTLARCGGEWFAPVLFVNGSGDALILQGAAPPSAATRRLGAGHRLPIEDRPFFGRAAELTEVCARLRTPDSRLVTVTGLGGMGKTRLALRAAHELSPEFSGGVHWVDCTEIRSESELLAIIASALDPDGRSYDEPRLADALAGNRALLVLDCFERSVDHAPLLGRLLRSAPGFKLLVTSRRLLGLTGEYEFALGPLTATGKAPLRNAIDLFEHAALQAKPSFKITRANRAQVRELVEALEAMPLAIVLAAGRLRTMDIEQLLARVRQQRLQVLQRSGKDRHANMAQVVQGSFELLNPAEHALMNECSVFHGGFSWEAAEAVLRTTDDLLTGITTLRENSLLSTYDFDSGVRFRILDTVREYIEGHADAGVISPAQSRHACYFAARACALREEWDGGGWSTANAALWSDAANFRAAVVYACTHQSQELLRKLAGSILRWYLEAGLRSDFDLLLHAAEPVALADAAHDPRLIIELRGLQGECMRREQRASEATAAWLDRGARCEAAGEFDMAADTYTDIASLGLVMDEQATVEAMLARIDAIDPNRISAHICASASAIQARARLRWGSQEEAVEAAARAERLIADLPAEPRALFTWMSLSIVYRSAGELAQSEQIARRLIRQAMELWHVQSVARGLLELARTLEQAGDLPGAASAIVAAEMIPRHASPQARLDARRCRDEFAARQGQHELQAAETQTARRDWRSVASMLAASNPIESPLLETESLTR